MILIELINVVKRYKSKIVLRNINCKIEQNKSYLLLGENGSGKTTLVKLIIGTVLKTSGTIIIKHNGLGYLPDKCYFPNHISIENFFKLFHNLDNCKIIEVLKKWGLSDQKNKKINKLSKGMFQKVMIINLFLEDRKLYILDEPLNGLDVNSQKKLLLELNKLKKNKKTIIIATHYPELYEKNMDTVFKIEGGNIDTLI